MYSKLTNNIDSFATEDPIVFKNMQKMNEFESIGEALAQ